MDLKSHSTTGDLARAVATIIRDTLAENPHAVLGWPSGRTTLPVLRMLQHSATDMSRATIAMMDDYVLGSVTHPIPIDPTAHYSCTNWVNADLLGPFAPQHRPNVVYPRVQEPGSYDRQLHEMGGVDVFLVGLGSSDGHVAFNPPGTRLDSRTRITPLAESTRRDNLGTFPNFGSLDQVPAAGLTVGLATIRDARRVIALAHGGGKADVVRRTVAEDHFIEELPSTFLYEHPAAELHTADLGADLS